MTRYLLSVYQPDGPLPPLEFLADMGRRLDALATEMRQAGAWVFSGGLFPASTATVVRPQDDGEFLITDGPFTEGKEHLGGFMIIESEDLDEALAWGRKLATVTTLPIEVRPFNGTTEE